VLINDKRQLLSGGGGCWRRTGMADMTSWFLSSSARPTWRYKVFTVWLHVMQRTVLPRSFRPSVRLSVKRVDYDKTKKTSVHILIPRDR